MAAHEIATHSALAMRKPSTRAEQREIATEKRKRLLARYVALARRLLAAPARALTAQDPGMRRYLEEAHIPLLPEAFVAFALLNALLLTGALYALGVLVFTLSLASGYRPGLVATLLVFVTPLLVGGLVYVGEVIYPNYRAGERRRTIDATLPYAVNYVAAMSTAGLVPAEIFRDLARQPIYGEVSREMAWIARDVDLLGVDLLTAINNGISRSPSVRFQEFLQGAKTTMLTGGVLRTYFAEKAEQYMSENRVLQREFLNGLSVLSESYVTVVIAGPLFMLVLLSIMVIIGKGSASSEAFLFVLVFAALPLAHLAFSWGVKTMAAEAS
ncbi:MAG: type II secretion system F family protein [Thermoplasmatota archaeon]